MVVPELAGTAAPSAVQPFGPGRELGCLESSWNVTHIMMRWRAGHDGRDSHLFITQHSSLNTCPPPAAISTDFVEVAVLTSHGQSQL